MICPHCNMAHGLNEKCPNVKDNFRYIKSLEKKVDFIMENVCTNSEPKIGYGYGTIPIVKRTLKDLYDEQTGKIPELIYET